MVDDQRPPCLSEWALHLAAGRGEAAGRLLPWTVPSAPSATDRTDGGEAVTSGGMPPTAHRARACTTTLLATMDLSGERAAKWKAATPQGGFSSVPIGHSCMLATSVSFHLHSEHPCFHTKSHIAEPLDTNSSPAPGAVTGPFS